jgi:hypothetical protein
MQTHGAKTSLVLAIDLLADPAQDVLVPHVSTLRAGSYNDADDDGA